MVSAQLTVRTNLRDMETYLNPHPERLYQMGRRAPIARSTIAPANDRRKCIYPVFASELICKVLTLYRGEELVV
jgi:hypothetical protein